MLSLQEQDKTESLVAMQSIVFCCSKKRVIHQLCKVRNVFLSVMSTCLQKVLLATLWHNRSKHIVSSKSIAEKSNKIAKAVSHTDYQNGGTPFSC